MIRKLMAAIAVATFIASCSISIADTNAPAATKVAAVKTVKCAVTGKVIGAPSKAGGFIVYKAHTYYFCCPGCLAKFKASPAKYAKPDVAYPANAPHPKPSSGAMAPM